MKEKLDRAYNDGKADERGYGGENGGQSMINVFAWEGMVWRLEGPRIGKIWEFGCQGPAVWQNNEEKKTDRYRR